LVKDAEQPMQPDVVGDEVRGVPGWHDALAEAHVEKARETCGDGRIGVGQGDDFNEAQVARRVEEVRAQPALPERGTAALGDRPERDAGCVRRDDRAGAEMRLDAVEQRPLGLDLLDDGLDDPVARRERCHVRVEPAHGDEPRGVGREERVGLEALGAFQAGGGRGAVEVEQQHRDAGVGQVGGNLCAHGAGTEDRGASNRRRDGWHGALSEPVPLLVGRGQGGTLNVGL
jgi:hypothetical protein